jgi:predicted metal-binding protein
MPVMETVKEHKKLLRQYRAAVCRFQENPTDRNVERIEDIAAKIIKLGYPVPGLFQS